MNLGGREDRAHFRFSLFKNTQLYHYIMPCIYGYLKNAQVDVKSNLSL